MSKIVKSIFEVIKNNPGIKEKEIADKLGIKRHKVSNALPSLEKHGLLVYEDDDRFLYPYED